jgi:hypothetical protein
LKTGARNRENDVFAGKDYELFWSIGAPESMKSQTPSTKLQTNLKFQYQMTKTGFEF